MLSLFKFPFWRKNTIDQNCISSSDIAQGIFRNYLSRKGMISDEISEKAHQCLQSEFDLFQKRLTERPEENQYELMRETLLRIDEKLEGL